MAYPRSPRMPANWAHNFRGCVMDGLPVRALYRRCADVSGARAAGSQHGCHIPARPPRPLGRKSASEPTSEVSEIARSEEHTSELQSRQYLVCRLLLEK